MPMLTCANCGTEFDTDREATIPSQNRERCPQCGAAHESSDGSGEAATEAVTVDLGSITVRDLVALEEDGATLSDAIALWGELTNPGEMMVESGRWESQEDR